MNIKIVKLKRRDFYKIIVTPDFILSPPKPEKLIGKMLKFFRESELDDIIVDENFHLIDGYCSYLIAKQVGTAFVKIKQVRAGEG